MLILATNLMLWMTAVTEESLHQTVYPNDNGSQIHRSVSVGGTFYLYFFC